MDLQTGRKRVRSAHCDVLLERDKQKTNPLTPPTVAKLIQGQKPAWMPQWSAHSCVFKFSAVPTQRQSIEVPSPEAREKSRHLILFRSRILCKIKWKDRKKTLKRFRIRVAYFRERDLWSNAGGGKAWMISWRASHIIPNTTITPQTVFWYPHKLCKKIWIIKWIIIIIIVISGDYSSSRKIIISSISNSTAIFVRCLDANYFLYNKEAWRIT